MSSEQNDSSEEPASSTQDDATSTALVKAMKRKRNLVELDPGDGTASDELKAALQRCRDKEFQFDAALDNCKAGDLHALLKAAGFPVGGAKKKRVANLQAWAEGRTYQKGRRKLMKGGTLVCLSAKLVRDEVLRPRRQ